ncbi:hypothetical protein [Shimia sp.]|uniref:hypothetical protein n=1 Tax=Shimia sp. TaxID=1954381 RepID=UPI00356AAB23
MGSVLRLCAALVLSALLAGCAVEEVHTATQEDIRAAVYSDGGPPSLTLYTMVSNSTGQGAHTSLLINGSQIVAWDPAGSFRAPGIVAKEDVIYGMSPQMVDYYTRFHARETYHVIIQKLPVSAEVAEQALQAAMAHGAAPKATCAQSTSRILQSLPGFEAIQPTYYPVKLHQQFAAYGPEEQKLFEYDGDDKSKVLAEYNAALVAETRARRKAEGTTVATKN